MKSFFQKLDRAANHWLNEFDGQMEQPVTQVMTGEVFTHHTPATDYSDAAPVAQPAPTKGLPRRADKDERVPALRPTGAVANR